MYFVPQLRDASKGYANLNGFGFINGNGIIIGGTPRLDTLAHEIGHNLGLDHTTMGAGGPNNLMTDGTARGPTIDCALGPNCAINKLALSERRILPDGTVELFWPLVGDSFVEANAFQRGYSGRTYLPAAQRTLPPFTFWDDMIIDVAPAINPLVGPQRAPASFSILFEFASRVTSQGFFDANGVASTLDPTTIITFSGEPSYGFVSDLRPAVDPEIAVSLADVSAPPAATLLLMALAGLSVTRSHCTRRA